MAISQEREGQGDQRDIGNELAQDNAESQDRRDMLKVQLGMGCPLLQYSGFPDAGHQDKHGGKENEGGPIDSP